MPRIAAVVLIVSIVGLAFAIGASGQVERPDARPAPGPAAGAALPVEPTVLDVHAVAQSRPALRHAFTLSYPQQVDGNAAPLYYLAIETSKAYLANDVVRDQIPALLDAPLSKMDLDQAERIVESAKPGLHLLELAAKRTRCDFEAPIHEDKMETLLPYLQSMRDLGRIVALRARLQIADGKLGDAVASIRIGLTMGRHTAQGGPTVIDGLVGIAIEQMMLNCLSDFVQRPGAPNLYWPLTQLPQPLIDLRRSFEGERDLLGSLVPELSEDAPEKLTIGQWRGIVERMNRAGGMMNKPAEEPIIDALKQLPQLAGDRRWLVEQGVMSRERVDKLEPHQVYAAYQWARYRQLADEMSKWQGLPYWQAQPEADRAQRALLDAVARGEGLPFSRLIASLWSARHTEAVLDRRIAALRCVEAVRHYAATHAGKLPPSLATVDDAPEPIDPFTGKGFVYQVENDTAVIQGPDDRDAARAIHYRVTVVK